ncbi:hypothetical protein [Granulicella arctica]|uniref:hypothetical protein n=1 Tax=Granulicella arctica TaxID=940613 RepID=UPI0021DF64BB|nr:hypothetical protein [Granulicella arctica]
MNTLLVATSPTLAHRRPHLLPTPHRRARLNPLALWHLLSLDAPTVAALWTWFLARTNRVHLPATAIAAMATAVWLLYAADRLLDTRSSIPQSLEARHHFHQHHRRAFSVGIAVATLILAVLLPTLATEAVRLYLIEASFLTGYFILIHATRSAHRLPKELAVGLFFAAATFIPTIAREPALRLQLLPPAVLFAALCSLNCLFIYKWEHPNPTSSDTHPATRLALRYLVPIALTLLIASAIVTLFDLQTPWQIPAATTLATIVLLVLHYYRHAVPSTTLRAAADLALLTPILFLFR